MYQSITESGAVCKCPEGHIPLKTKTKRSKHIAHFDINHCGGCPRLETCPVKKGKRHYSLLYDDKQLRLSARREYENTDVIQRPIPLQIGSGIYDVLLCPGNRCEAIEGAGIKGCEVLRDIEGVGNKHLTRCSLQQRKQAKKGLLRPLCLSFLVLPLLYVGHSVGICAVFSI